MIPTRPHLTLVLTSLAAVLALSACGRDERIPTGQDTTSSGTAPVDSFSALSGSSAGTDAPAAADSASSSLVDSAATSGTGGTGGTGGDSIDLGTVPGGSLPAVTEAADATPLTPVDQQFGANATESGQKHFTAAGKLP